MLPTRNPDLNILCPREAFLDTDWNDPRDGYDVPLFFKHARLASNDARTCCCLAQLKSGTRFKLQNHTFPIDPRNLVFSQHAYIHLLQQL